MEDMILGWEKKEMPNSLLLWGTYFNSADTWFYVEQNW